MLMLVCVMLMLVCVYAYASVFVPLQLLLGSGWWLSRCLAGQVSHLHTVEYTTKCLTSRAFSNNLRHCHHYHLLLLRRNHHRCHQHPYMCLMSTIFWFNHHPQFSHLISSHSITNAINTIGVQHKQSFSWNVPCWQNHLYQHHDLHQSVCLARAFW